MRTKRAVCGVAAAVAMAGGCSVGKGAPDGWAYMTGGPVRVAHPKDWTEMRVTGASAAAVLMTPDGEMVGEITVGAHRAAPARGVGRDRLEIGGRLATQQLYDLVAADGRKARVLEIMTTDSKGRPVLVRATGIDGEVEQVTLRQIINSVEVG